MEWEIIAIVKPNHEKAWTSAKNKKEAIKKATKLFIKGDESITKIRPCEEIIIRPFYRYNKGLTISDEEWKRMEDEMDEIWAEAH